MPIDPRENRLTELKTMPRQSYSSFIAWYNTALAFLDNPDRDGREYREVAEARGIVSDFLERFATEKGPPSLPWVLIHMDIAQRAGRGELKTASRRMRKRVSLKDAAIGLLEAEQEIWSLINDRARDIRILNQQLV